MKPDHTGEGRWSVRHTGQCGYGIYDRRGDSSPIASGMTEERADEIAGLMTRLDKATELLRASVAHLEDCARDIVLRRGEDVLQARGKLALEMANRLRAFLERESSG